MFSYTIKLADIYNNRIGYISFIYNEKKKKIYISYLNIYNEYKNKPINNTDYPLHHFMMGKGKTAIITPILTLYFSLVHKQNVIIITNCRNNKRRLPNVQCQMFPLLHEWQ